MTLYKKIYYDIRIYLLHLKNSIEHRFFINSIQAKIITLIINLDKLIVNKIHIKEVIDDVDDIQELIHNKDTISRIQEFSIFYKYILRQNKFINKLNIDDNKSDTISRILDTIISEIKINQYASEYVLINIIQKEIKDGQKRYYYN